MADTLRHWVNSLTKVRSLFENSTSDLEAQLGELANQTLLCASLLRAGLSLRQSAQEAGLTISDTSQVAPQSFLAQLWHFVLDTGATPAPILDVCAQAFGAAAENARAARVQMAGPQAATKLVMGLPLLALAGGFVAGYNPFDFLFGTPMGWFTLLLAGGLMFIAQVWSRGMLRRAQLWSWSPGMAFEMMAISLTAGQSLSASEHWARQIAQRYLSPADARDELAECASLAQLSRATGVTLVGLLRDRAGQARLASREQAQIQVERLAVRLMIPLGVCVLPAFIAVGVLPIVASMISSTALST